MHVSDSHHPPKFDDQNRNLFPYSKKSSSIFLMYKTSSMRQPTLCRIISRVSCPPSISTMRLLKYSAVSRALAVKVDVVTNRPLRSEEHTSELQSLMRHPYAV